MPSNTFLNLAQEKQDKLLEAATREFSRRPYAEASINQIIKDAGIPRGSFYMYFQDKEELFRYLMHGYVDQLLMVLEELLIREQGDIFSALLQLNCYIHSKRDALRLGDVGAMAAIIGCNQGVQKNILLEMLDPAEIYGRLKGLVNPELLDLRREGDLEDILAVLLSITGPMIYNSLQSGPAESRDRLENVLEILKRGMGRISHVKTENEKGE